MNNDARHATAPARAVWVLLAFVLLYTLWVWGGLRPSFHGVAVLAAGGLLALLLAGGGLRAGLRDPIFWWGLLFLAYLGVAWANAGRTLYYDVGFHRWQYTGPRWPGWPAAFTREDAAQMITWFFPAWVLVLAVRSPLLDWRALHRLLRLVVFGAGLLAAFGVIQFLSGTRAIYGRTALACDFFASFAYANHAAAFFLLAGALAAGLMLQTFLRQGRPDLRGEAGVWAATLALCGVGACLSLSRAGLLLTALLSLVVLAYGWRLGRRVFSRVDRIRFAVGAAALLLLAAAGVVALGAPLIQREFTAAQATPLWGHLNLTLSGRPHFVSAAWAMWKDQPWWGVGGCGYQYLVASYLPPDQLIRLQRLGWANVHCDPLQFLVEFGAVGCAVLGGALATLLAPLPRLAGALPPFTAMALVGLALVALLSLIDLPFRCPAILFTWLVALTALPRLKWAAAAG